MVLERLKHRIGPLHPHLYAYQEGVGTTECITDVLSCINNKKALVAFLDFEKAFELANPAAVLTSLVRKGIKGHLLAWNKNYLTNRQARVKFQGNLSTYKDLENGTPQGGILSPYLFNLLMENLLNLQLPPGVDIFIYADDVCVVVWGRFKMRTMQSVLNLIVEKAAELGLKININKTKAMMIKDRLPAESLKIDHTPIEWVNQYMYLGIIIDSQLKFNHEVTYLRQRASARLSTMKYMTSLKEGANLQVQRTFYMSCTRALIDYGAPALTHLTEAQWTSLEVLQNNAIRLMLGAPMWSRLCNIRMEANLPTLKNRVSARNSAITAKALLSDRDAFTRRRATTELNRHPDLQGQNTYINGLVKCTRDLGMTSILRSLQPDAVNPNHRIPPWEASVANFNFTVLPTSKNDCTPQVLRRAATEAIRLSEEPGCTSYYTDGTVDPETHTTGSAVFSTVFTASWRTSNNASTMQTELVAILQALEFSLGNREGPVTIHTDCKSAVQALQKVKYKENRALIHSVRWLLYQHKQNNRTVTINWIPSHIGIDGNEKADELAKSTKFIDRVQYTVQPSIQQVKNLLKGPVQEALTQDIHFWASQGSPSATWYKMMTELTPPPINKHTPRQLAVIIHRLRLGYKANWEIIEGIIRPCEHCQHDTEHPLRHYLLECPETTVIRANHAIVQDIASQEALQAATKVAREASLDHHRFLLERPPPR